jgi:hypothetical protein
MYFKIDKSQVEINGSLLNMIRIKITAIIRTLTIIRTTTVINIIKYNK